MYKKYFRLRTTSARRSHFKADNRNDEGGDKEKSPKGGRLVKNEDAQQHGAEGTNARPHSVGRAYRDAFDGLREQHNAGHIEDDQADEPAHKGRAVRSVHLAKAEGEGHFAQTCENKYQPIHNL